MNNRITGQSFLVPYCKPLLSIVEFTGIELTFPRDEFCVFYVHSRMGSDEVGWGIRYAGRLKENATATLVEGAALNVLLPILLKVYRQARRDHE